MRFLRVESCCRFFCVVSSLHTLYILDECVRVHLKSIMAKNDCLVWCSGSRYYGQVLMFSVLSI